MKKAVQMKHLSSPDTAPGATGLPLHHAARALLGVLQQIEGDGQLPQDDAKFARELVEALGLSPRASLPEIEQAFRRAEVVLWPSILARTGFGNHDSEDLQKKLRAVYLVVSNPSERDKLFQLAAGEVEESSPFTDGTLPRVDRDRERHAIDGTHSDGNSRSKGRGVRGRIRRTSIVSAGILIGGLAAYRFGEVPLASAVIEIPQADAFFERHRSTIALFDPLSEGAMSAAAKVEKGIAWLGQHLFPADPSERSHGEGSPL